MQTPYVTSQINITEQIQPYPTLAQEKLLGIRELVAEIANADNITVTECLKWGEISYTCKQGSTFRMDYKEKQPNSVQLYFHCQTKLVDTFKEIFADSLSFEGNRAIVLPLDKPLPTNELNTCINMALNYHQLKALHLLGYGLVNKTD